jgi:predicted DNA-binding WGR domain protein
MQILIHGVLIMDSVRYVKNTRFYELHLIHDLFDWTVVTAYGRRDSRQGKIRVFAFNNKDLAKEYFNKEIIRRKKRGYVLWKNA